MSDAWTLSYDGLAPEEEGLREALCALGNGRFVTRGAREEARADGVSYPGTYVAGGYDRLASRVAGRTVENEDLVNFPNWLPLSFRAGGGEWLEAATAEYLAHRQELRLREGVLARRFRVRDDAGRETSVESRRLVHMRTPHLAAIEYRLTSENWSGPIRIRSGLDGSVTNSGVERYRDLTSRHLETVARGPVDPEGIFLHVRTLQSRFEVVEAARTRLYRGGERVEAGRRILAEEDRIAEELTVELARGETVRGEKVVSLRTSRDRGVGEAAEAARRALRGAPGFSTLLRDHRLAWQQLWDRCDVELESADSGPLDADEEQLILRLHAFHLLQTASPNTVGLDVGVPARGLHGEAYRGHIFWDELFILPFYGLRTPAIVRSLLLYRYHRLGAARALAREAGYAGAMYPWQSSNAGREATPRVHLNPRSGEWGPDHSRLQRHVNAAIAYNVWRYWEATGDLPFLRRYGAEMVLEIARFWSSAATRNAKTGRYELVGVMGPDEYHEKYPGAERGGLRNNAYTNVMAVWCLLRALDALDAVGARHRRELLERLRIREEELDRWREITRRMTVPFLADGVIEQFEGYGDLDELDWDAYRERYGDIHRLDRILEAEGDSPDRYKVSKQADVDMLFFLLGRAELEEVFRGLGYPFDESTVSRSIEYYRSRTAHGSTLSRVVFASVVHRLDCEEGCRLFLEALPSDFRDIQGGTTAEGIHLGAMAGTVDIVLRRYAGVALTPAGVELDPEMPRRLRRLRFRFQYRGRWLQLDMSRREVRVTVDGGDGEPVPVRIGDGWHRISNGRTAVGRLDGGSPSRPVPERDAGRGLHGA